jgi:hypothetical protein
VGVKSLSLNPGIVRQFRDNEAKFLVPDRGDIVESGLVLSYSARLHSLAGRYDQGTTTLCQSELYPTSQGQRTTEHCAIYIWQYLYESHDILTRL